MVHDGTLLADFQVVLVYILRNDLDQREAFSGTHGHEVVALANCSHSGFRLVRS
jgi:hypothetical protein